ncbi:hypothetical protein [Lactobacillus kalixensis]|uniref:Uncharacterized protein n=1 Tax=Lactobacillus kalixensis DSM 16043 TaxID=1423763 RepID=A0A0R1UDR9_9LACO|nr:hypothetical protein [Lactobacillus kalixensis]KRL91559.1 hypothetical protein FC46_GL000108 [Lactobacillus kalixensis DSM 16043]
MDYQKILDQLVSGELKEYRVEPKDAFDFQRVLRDYGKRQNITGRAERGGSIVYTGSNSDD